MCKTPTQIFNKNQNLQQKINDLAGVANPGHDNQNLPRVSTRGTERATLANVEAFFKQNNYPNAEAKKFFYYNQGKGWMLNEKTPITDWQSIAHKWMLNQPTSLPHENNPEKAHLPNPEHSRRSGEEGGGTKDYSEPL